MKEKTRLLFTSPRAYKAHQQTHSKVVERERSSADLGFLLFIWVESEGLGFHQLTLYY